MKKANLIELACNLDIDLNFDDCTKANLIDELLANFEANYDGDLKNEILSNSTIICNACYFSVVLFIYCLAIKGENQQKKDWQSLQKEINSKVKGSIILQNKIYYRGVVIDRLHFYHKYEGSFTHKLNKNLIYLMLRIYKYLNPSIEY